MIKTSLEAHIEGHWKNLFILLLLSLVLSARVRHSVRCKRLLTPPIREERVSYSSLPPFHLSILVILANLPKVSFVMM